MPRLLAGMASRRSPFLLILDELEWLESEASLAIVAALVGGVPAGSQLAIASRVEPPLRLGRLRASRRLTELRREDLTMTKGECAALLAAIGVELSPGQLDTIVRRTEGWPAALYLAGPGAHRVRRRRPHALQVRRRRPRRRRLPAGGVPAARVGAAGPSSCGRPRCSSGCTASSATRCSSATTRRRSCATSRARTCC